jgi:chaperonin cofactor prefoldin
MSEMLEEQVAELEESNRDLESQVGSLKQELNALQDELYYAQEGISTLETSVDEGIYPPPSAHLNLRPKALLTELSVEVLEDWIRTLRSQEYSCCDSIDDFQAIINLIKNFT